MSVVDDLTKAGYLKSDPSDASSSIFTIEISIDNTLIEQGVIDQVAAAKGWDATNSSVTSSDLLISWVKGDAIQTLVAVRNKLAIAQALEQVQQQLAPALA